MAASVETSQEGLGRPVCGMGSCEVGISERVCAWCCQGAAVETAGSCGC